MTREEYPVDVRIVAVDGYEFILVGTAHISRESVDLVHQVIELERPDSVCIELDRQRFEALSNPEHFASLDLAEVIRRQQLSTLLINLVLSSYQRRLGDELGVVPGTELKEAADTAERLGIVMRLCDRDVRITLRRAWASVSWWRKMRLIPELVASLFDTPELTEDDLRKLRQEDVPNKLLEEIGATFPDLKRVLIDERDLYITQKIRSAPGPKIVVVVGAGHLAGIERALVTHQTVDLAPLEEIPPVSLATRALGWAIPGTILAALIYIGLTRGTEAVGESVVFWVLVTAVPSLLGAIVALAHPMTMASAFLSAPFTTLSPLIGVGHVTALVQLYFAPPLVSELHSVTQDIGEPRMWWRNRLLKILLVFVTTTIGGSLGTLFGGSRIVASLF